MFKLWINFENLLWFEFKFLEPNFEKFKSLQHHFLFIFSVLPDSPYIPYHFFSFYKPCSQPSCFFPAQQLPLVQLVFSPPVARSTFHLEPRCHSRQTKRATLLQPALTCLAMRKWHWSAPAPTPAPAPLPLLETIEPPLRFSSSSHETDDPLL
jgi:hypothetical protein